MRTYALVNNAVVTAILEFEDVEFETYARVNHMVIDITDLDPRPQIGWVLNGNILEFPQSLSNREIFEEELNDKKVEFGIKLSRKAINKIGARNKILNKNGTQVIALLTQLVGVKSLLETGALGTARNSCVGLKTVYTEYTDIFDYVIVEINVFESTFGL